MKHNYKKWEKRWNQLEQRKEFWSLVKLWVGVGVILGWTVCVVMFMMSWR